MVIFVKLLIPTVMQTLLLILIAALFICVLALQIRITSLARRINGTELFIAEMKVCLPKTLKNIISQLSQSVNHTKDSRGDCGANSGNL